MRRVVLRHYEIVLLIHPDQSEQVAPMVEKYTSMVKDSGGHIHRHEDWGRKQLAYPINKVHKAHYVLLNIECGKVILEELKTAFKFNDAIIRNLVLQKESAITEPSPLSKRDNKEAREA